MPRFEICSVDNLGVAVTFLDFETWLRGYFLQSGLFVLVCQAFRFSCLGSANSLPGQKATIAIVHLVPGFAY